MRKGSLSTTEANTTARLVADAPSHKLCRQAFHCGPASTCARTRDDAAARPQSTMAAAVRPLPQRGQSGPTAVLFEDDPVRRYERDAPAPARLRIEGRRPCAPEAVWETLPHLEKAWTRGDGGGRRSPDLDPGAAPGPSRRAPARAR